MPSWYEQHPAAFDEAAAQRAFQDQLLDGTILRDFLSSDPENAHQSRAHADLRLIIDRAWNEAKKNLHSTAPT